MDLEWKLPANFQMSQKMAMDTEELAKRSAIYASRGFLGRINDFGAVSQGWED